MTHIRFLFYLGLVNGVLFLGLGVGGIVRRFVTEAFAPATSNAPVSEPAAKDAELFVH